MSYIVVLRSTFDDKLIFLADDADNFGQTPKEFETFDGAQDYADKHPLSQTWTYNILGVVI